MSIKAPINKNPSPKALRDLLEYHYKQIQWIQHERLAHLLTMLFVCLFALLSLGYSLFNPTVPCFILSGLLIILSVTYVIHYYRLENGVQKRYRLSNEIRDRI
jgi:hypothetical protein